MLVALLNVLICHCKCNCKRTCLTKSAHSFQLRTNSSNRKRDNDNDNAATPINSFCALVFFSALVFLHTAIAAHAKKIHSFNKNIRYIECSALGAHISNIYQIKSLARKNQMRPFLCVLISIWSGWILNCSFCDSWNSFNAFGSAILFFLFWNEEISHFIIMIKFWLVARWHFTDRIYR